MNYCTTKGWTEADRLRQQYKGNICCAENAFTGTGSNSVKDSDLGELSSRLDQEGIAAAGLNRINTFLSTHRPAPLPQQFIETTVNHAVAVLYTDADGVDKTILYVLGGEDEPQLYKKQGIAVVFYNSPLGRNLIRRTVGHQFDLKTGGETFSATITAISPLPDPDVSEPESTGQMTLALDVAA